MLTSVSTFLTLSVLFCGVFTQSDIVVTEYGPIQGYITELGVSFTDIPYADTTAGLNRFSPPKPPVPWTKVLQTTKDPPMCPQLCNLPDYFCSNRISEDCLKLNVFIPPNTNTKADPLPVMLFIHGGSFIEGYGGGPLYNGANLTNLTNTITVTINYRLGVLGFFYDPSNLIYGNLGYMDQKFAIEWVYNNIAAFGGDPNHITIFGESAGAVSVALHLSDLTTKPLFTNAIMESEPIGITLRTAETWIGVRDAFYGHLGCSGYDCMMNTSWEKIIAAQEVTTLNFLENGITQDIIMLWTPTCESELFPAPPLISFQQGSYWKDINIIMGVNANEGWLFVPFPYVESAYLIELEIIVGAEHLLEVMLEYPLPNNATNVDRQNNLALIFTDMFFNCPSRNATASISKYNENSNIYYYHFIHPNSFNNVTLPPLESSCYDLVCHGMELPYVFGNPPPPGHFTNDEYILAKSFMWYWATLAKNNNPGNGQEQTSITIDWKSYNDDTRPTIVLDTQALSMQNNYGSEHCYFWDRLGYYWV